MHWIIKEKKIVTRAALLTTALFALSALFVSCEHLPEKRTHTVFGCFDTVITITAYTDDEEAFTAAAAEAEDTFVRLHRLFDIYNKYEDVHGLAELNASAGEMTDLDPEAARLLSDCIGYNGLTDGTVNVAMGAVLLLWHECRENAAAHPAGAALPDETALCEAALHCDITKLTVAADGRSAMLADPAMSVDVGAAAKGYAADRAAEGLKKYGFPFMLNCGGAVLTYGKKPDGTDWLAGVADPLGGEDFAAVVPVNGAALSTSGSYLRSFTVDGRDYGHIIDPETLFPPEGTASVSVLVTGDDCAALADVLSTACYILGPEKGTELINGVPSAEALFVLPSGELTATPGFPAE